MGLVDILLLFIRPDEIIGETNNINVAMVES